MRSFSIPRRCLLGFGLLIMSGLSVCQALILDWDTVTTTTYPNGTLTKTFVAVNGSAFDVRLSITGATGSFTPGRPAVLTGNATTTPLGEKALALGNVDFTTVNQTITVTVSFFQTGTTSLASMQNVSFSLWDIDARPDPNTTTLANFNDRIVLSGTPAITDRVIAGRIKPAHNITGSTVQAWSGTGNRDANSVGVTEGGDPEGAVNVVYATPISSFSFLYTNGSGTIADPTPQNILLHDISFTPVPEPAANLLISVGLMTLGLRRRRMIG